MSVAPGDRGPWAPPGTAPSAGRRARSGGCPPTDLTAQGPFWRPGAPLRTTLVSPATPAGQGVALHVHGFVLDDAACRPLPRAEVDVWQADQNGVYAGDADRPDLGLRGRMHAAEDGGYAFDTVVPAPYWDEGHMRPSHIHFKVACPGHAPVTTQLFFAGDPYLFDDPHVRAGLIRPLERRRDAGGGAPRDGLLCRFDIVLRRIAR